MATEPKPASLDLKDFLSATEARQDRGQEAGETEEIDLRPSR